MRNPPAHAAYDAYCQSGMAADDLSSVELHNCVATAELHHPDGRQLEGHTAGLAHTTGPGSACAVHILARWQRAFPVAWSVHGQPAVRVNSRRFW